MLSNDEVLNGSPLSYEQAEVVLSQAMMDLKELSVSGRIRDPERDRIRVDRYKALVDICMGYCYLQIYKDILALRVELNNIVRGGAA